MGKRSAEVQLGRVLGFCLLSDGSSSFKPRYSRMLHTTESAGVQQTARYSRPTYQRVSAEEKTSLCMRQELYFRRLMASPRRLPQLFGCSKELLTIKSTLQV
jgi:hypothetical protein